MQGQLPSVTLIKMFALRAAGIPIQTLSIQFHKDRHTVRTYLIDHTIPLLSLDLRTPKPKKTKIFYTFFEEPICKGKTYKEYLAEAEKRRNLNLKKKVFA